MLDMGDGNFEYEGDEKDLEMLKRKKPDHGGRFMDGDIVEMRGSRFKITKMLANGMKLKLLPKQEDA